MKLVLFALCALIAADWPQFRGPNFDGHAAGPATPLEWSDTQNVAWKTPIAGLGWSSPSVAAGRVFLITAVPDSDTGLDRAEVRDLGDERSPRPHIHHARIFGRGDVFENRRTPLSNLTVNREAARFQYPAEKNDASAGRVVVGRFVDCPCVTSIDEHPDF